MSDIAIRVEKLGKLYRVGQFVGYQTLRESLTNVLSVPFRRLGRRRETGYHSLSDHDEYIWALKDVSFEVKQGEVVGIIGRNGAGKTTLLKILTRITEPTEGYSEIYGRVGSLLEVGSGLHPELTGRENIYLSGAVLGMKKAEIERRFDEIVEFSGVEKFIDTPLKRYSSGMQVRLAFSVAAHLKPDIWLVDEVLAVGDAAFQKKCLGKMEDVAKGGRTVLFVSHNMAAVQKLCERSILLEVGKIRNIGATSEIVEEYLDLGLNMTNIPLTERREQRNSSLVFTAIEFLGFRGERLVNLLSGQDVSLALDYICQSSHGLRNVQITCNIFRMGEAVVALDTEYSHNFELIPPKGRIICHVLKLPLMPGHYSIHIRAYSNNVMLTEVADAVSFWVEAGAFFESGLLPRDTQARFLVAHSWEVEEK